MKFVIGVMFGASVIGSAFILGFLTGVGATVAITNNSKEEENEN